MALLLRSLSNQIRLNTYLLRHTSVLNSRLYSQEAQKASGSKTVATAKPKSELGEAKPLGEKVKENVKTTSYMGVIVIGIGVTAIMFYTIFSELFSSTSPQAIYAEAFEKCKNDTRVQDALGQPIKCFGEETRRRRRTHVAHQLYMKEGRTYMRLTFHIQGIRNKATVQCDMRQNDNGKYDYRYLLVQLDSYPHTTIIIEDNRASDTMSIIEASANTPSSGNGPLKGIFS
ncbi:unnamed protein product [Chironomus riparius]|uniref:Mitochondrial import inner membrane translocase subunit Tim21 n=1 Tax=Chironomus riparius TaxID=315576 RepID=A0A9N9RKU7_9DIPT|nr:unnamed protein product [Chironomus riparius]